MLSISGKCFGILYFILYMCMHMYMFMYMFMYIQGAVSCIHHVYYTYCMCIVFLVVRLLFL
jgi:hypothetical protein